MSGLNRWGDACSGRCVCAYVDAVLSVYNISLAFDRQDGFGIARSYRWRDAWSAGSDASESSKYMRP